MIVFKFFLTALAVICLVAVSPIACSSGQTAQTGIATAEPQAATLPETSFSQGPYSLQLGSYERPDEATYLLRRLKKKGFDAYQTIETIPGIGQKFQVRIGHFSSREAANQFAADLKKQEGLDSYICIDLE